jgi:predicted metal-binding membrane protein
MAEDISSPATDLLRRVTVPAGLAVAAVVAIAWYVTLISADATMMLMAPATVGSTGLALFFALLVVMMVAMMLPSALPMMLAFHGFTRLEAGRPTRPADLVGTFAFVVPYFVVWGAFGVAGLLGLMSLGLLGPWIGWYVLVPAGTLLAAGAWQVTRTKEVCLNHCQSPMGFVVRHWRSGRMGAVRMGLRHAMYCIGCCWLFMLVLFVAGSMSLVWMGGVSLMIFVEKLGVRPLLVSRAIGVLLIALGSLAALGTILGL